VKWRFVCCKTNKQELLKVIYWMRRWGRSSGTDGTAQGEAGTASTGTCLQTWPQKSHWSHLQQEEEEEHPLTVELTLSSLEALEAHLMNHGRASVDSATDVGSDALEEEAVGPCEEAVGRWWGVEVGVVMVACLKKGLKGEGVGALVGIQYEWGAGAGVRC